MTNRISIRSDARQNQRCPLLLNTTSKRLDKIAETPQIGIRASANKRKKPMISVPADGEANLRAERRIVRKNRAVPKTTAVLRIPMRETSSIQRFIVFLLSKRFAQMT